MKAGQLTAQGTLFLRGPVYSAMTSAGETQYTLPLLERRGAGVQQLTAIWTGPAACSFIAQYGAALKPGKALAITFERLFCHSNELHGVIYTATLAPDRWETRPATTPAPQPAEAAADTTHQLQHA